MIKSFVKIFLTIIIITSIISCKPTQLNDLKHNQSVQISGKITLIGNAPFTKFAITHEDYHYSLELKTNDDALNEKIQNNLGQEVTIKGNIIISDIHSADFKYSFKQYQLLVTNLTKKL